VALGEHPGKLFADTFATDGVDAGSEFADCGDCDGFNDEAEAGGKADRTEEAKLVFFEALFGVADGTDDAGFEVVEATDVVEDCGAEFVGVRREFVERCAFAQWVEEEAVDGEVATLDVFGGSLCVADFVGVAAVGVDAVIAEGGDLCDAALCHCLLGASGVEVGSDEDYAEVRAYGEGAGEHGEDDVGGGGGGDVVVLRFAAKEEVAHASTGEVGFVAGGAQGPDDLDGGFELGRGAHRSPRLLISRIVRFGRLAGRYD